jgi:two-component system, OmpR family, response regulator
MHNDIVKLALSFRYISFPGRDEEAMRILLVDDDRLLADYVRLALREDGHAVDVTHTGNEGQTLAMVHDYDLVILDQGLPGRSGLEILQYMRGRGSATPVLMLTAQAEEEDVIRGLDSGADDYLAKPFVIGELRARVRALGRRGGTVARAQNSVSAGNVAVDRLRRSVAVGGKKLSLTPKEFTLFEYFALHPDQVVTRTELLEKVWDLHFDPGSNVVDVHVGRLRGKLQGAGASVSLSTVRGSGFILAAEPS